ncbi:hypothetical protein FISHEDRAFT_59747 [Fistulina hepatica ATCC 64428]|uniref:Uncharacterized protein n=1 Tax=Fistulina hepatica ATCC 64428 TaxID=1128425 RepID=A0A0D7A972_9AGAR|nr:hypothetical protein FISHEDRAFT_59747 [Fistulina hepatica ATCC 64428]
MPKRKHQSYGCVGWLSVDESRAIGRSTIEKKRHDARIHQPVDVCIPARGVGCIPVPWTSAAYPHCKTVSGNWAHALRAATHRKDALKTVQHSPDGSVGSNTALDVRSLRVWIAGKGKFGSLHINPNNPFRACRAYVKFAIPSTIPATKLYGMQTGVGRSDCQAYRRVPRKGRETACPQVLGKQCPPPELRLSSRRVDEYGRMGILDNGRVLQTDTVGSRDNEPTWQTRRQCTKFTGGYDGSNMLTVGKGQTRCLGYHEEKALVEVQLRRGALSMNNPKPTTYIITSLSPYRRAPRRTGPWNGKQLFKG